MRDASLHEPLHEPLHAQSDAHNSLPGEVLHELESHKVEIVAAATGVLLLAATRGKVKPGVVADYAQDAARALGFGADSEWTRGLRSLKELGGERTDAALLRKVRWVMSEQVDYARAMLGAPTSAKVIDVGYHQAIAIKHGERGTSLLLKEETGIRVVTAGTEGSFSTITPDKTVFTSNSDGSRFKLPHLELTTHADSLTVKTANGSKAELSLDAANEWHGHVNENPIVDAGRPGRIDMDDSTRLRNYVGKSTDSPNSATNNFLVESKARTGNYWINTQGADGYVVRQSDDAGHGFTFSQLPSGARHLAVGPRSNPLVSFRVDVPEGANLTSVRPEQSSNHLYVRRSDKQFSDFNRYDSVDQLLEAALHK